MRKYLKNVSALCCGIAALACFTTPSEAAGYYATMDLMPIILTTTVALQPLQPNPCNPCCYPALAIHTALQRHAIPAVLQPLATHAALHLAILAGQRAVYG